MYHRCFCSAQARNILYKCYMTGNLLKANVNSASWEILHALWLSAVVGPGLLL